MVTSHKIVDFNTTCKSSVSMDLFIPKPIEVEFEDARVEKLEYILLMGTHMDIINSKRELKNYLMKIINKIYIEHLKLTTLDLMYPIYQIRFTNKNKDIEIKIENFEGTGRKPGIFSIKSFVNRIGLPDTTEKLFTEIRLHDRIEIDNLGTNENIKIIGIEHVANISDNNAKYLIYNANKYNNGELRLNYLSYTNIYDLHEGNLTSLIIDDINTGGNIQYNLLKCIKELKEVTFPSPMYTYLSGQNIVEYFDKQSDEPTIIVKRIGLSGTSEDKVRIYFKDIN